MKICVIGTRGFPNVQGGVEKHCEQLYPVIYNIGHDVTVITRKTYVDTSIKEYKGVKLYSLTNPTQKSLEAIVHTAKGVFVAKCLGCDILHIHAIGPALMIPFARLLGLKVVLTNHGPDYARKKWGRFARGMLRLGEYCGSKWANKVISVSKPIADDFKCKYNCEAEIILNGVVVLENAKTNEILERFGLKKEKYILAVGRFVPEKGFHDLIEAFKKAQNSCFKDKGIKLVIVGDADHDDKYSLDLKKMAKQTNTDINAQVIVLTGQLSEKPLQELYSHAGMFILPSYHEGLPIVLLEAMSYGLNCIASDIPANRTVNLDGDRYFQPGDIDGMVAKAHEYIQKPLDTNERKKQIEIIKETYNWEKIAKQTLEVYRSICTK